MLQELDNPQLFDDPHLLDDPQLFDDQLEVWSLIIQKSTVIPPSLMVLFAQKPISVLSPFLQSCGGHNENSVISLSSVNSLQFSATPLCNGTLFGNKH